MASLAATLVSVYELNAVIPSAPDFAAFVVLLVVLLVRPNGLFGKA